MKGILYIVPTPIGNLGDFTFRGVEVLKSVTIIAAEDTRRSSVLLNRYNIKNPLRAQKLLSFNEHNQDKRTTELIKELESGESVAIISDAGTPLISDPGAYLVAKALGYGIKIVSLPGPSAIMTALTVSGFSLSEFVSLGFLPKKRNLITKKLKTFNESPITIIFFESPNRLKKTLSILLEILGDRRIVVCREMTKLFEEIIRGRITEILSLLQESIKGEITVVVEGGAKKEMELDQLEERIEELLKKGEGVKTIAELLHEEGGMSRKKIYSMVLNLNKK